MSTSRKKIFLYLALTFGFSSIFYYLISRAGSLGTYVIGLMWSPGAAALITQLVFHRSLRGLGWGFGKARYWLLALGLPLLYGLAIYVPVWLTGLAGFNPEPAVREFSFGPEDSPGARLLIYLVSMLTIGMLQSMFTSLGEEIGWRGLLVPELAKEMSFLKLSLISGLIWVIYHVPLILTADYYNAGAPRWFGLLCFAIGVMGITFAFNWLRLKSGSLWPAVVLHASHNLFIQAIFTPFTTPTAISPYWIDEFGIGIALVGIVIACLFWRKRGELDPSQTLPTPAPAPAHS